MRLYAIYSRNLTVALFTGGLLAAELAVKIVRCGFPSNPVSVTEFISISKVGIYRWNKPGFT
jgi:hypothetical protein